MRVAVAGAAGLIGHAIAAALEAAGHEVLRVGRDERADVRVDLTQGDAPPQPPVACDALVHAAGVTDDDFADPPRAWRKALFGTERLLRMFGDARHLAYISTAHVYGPLEGRIDESAAPNPLSDYALAHFAAEQRFRRAGLARGARVLNARPCAVYGMPVSLERFARWSLIPFDFPRAALDGEIVLRSSGRQRRNFVPAEGVANLVGWWLDAELAGVTVANAPGPSEMSVYDFARLCARIASEETGRACEVRRPEGDAAALSPFEFRTRVAGHLPGPALEEHVRRLMHALMEEGR